MDLGLAQLGQVIQVSPGGQYKTIAGVGETNFDWTATQPGLVDPPDGSQDANPYGVLATPKGVLVADAGANNVDLVRPNGSIEILTAIGVPHNAASPLSDAVPTCVVPDGNGGYLVGTLDRQVFQMTSRGALTGIPLSGSDPLFTIGGCASDGYGGMYAVDTASFFFGQPGLSPPPKQRPE